MKQIILHTVRWISVLALTATPLAAAILTVDNKPGSVAMFNNLQAAYNAAQQDDTIVLAASPTSYGSINVYKRLHFRGPGYLLSENGIPGTELAGNQASVSIQILNDVNLGNGSGSTVAHLAGQVTASNGTQVTVDMCLLDVIGINPNTTMNVRRSRLDGVSMTHNSNTTITLQDSIIDGDIPMNSSMLQMTLNRCVIVGKFINGSGFRTFHTQVTVTNSILVSDYSPAAFSTNFGGNISHCMAVGGSFLPVGNNNINNANLQDVFLAAGSDDARWQLKPASPARGAGLDGVDLGAFGGVQPYILSGLPSKPRLTRFIAPAVATEVSGLRIELEAKSY